MKRAEVFRREKERVVGTTSPTGGVDVHGNVKPVVVGSEGEAEGKRESLFFDAERDAQASKAGWGADGKS